MRRFLIAAGLFVLSVGALSAQPGAPSSNEMKDLGIASPPQMALSATDVELTDDGNAQTDALLDCYAKFGTGLGPPHISYSSNLGYALRADFLDSKSGVSRLLCWKSGFVTQKNLSLPPLYPPQAGSPDPGTQRAMAGRKARQAERAARLAAAKPYPAPDAALADQLEGIWLVGRKPEKGACLANWYSEMQMEFDFRKTGGRILIFEPNDLFSPISISGIAKSGDILTIQARVRTGGLVDFLRIRLLAPDRVEILKPDGQPPQVAYKCGEANASVTAGVSLEKLESLTSPASGGNAFIEAIPGVPDTDICQDRYVPREKYRQMRTIQFELLGPVHYWVLGFGFGPEHKLGFDFVRTVEDKGGGVLVLHMQEHLEKGSGWDVEDSRGKLYDLTVIDHGARIEIPELPASFVRCKPEEPASVGMHRW